MARYPVTVVAGERTASILVVLSPSAHISSLVDKIKARLPGLKLGISSESDLTLHIDAADGPLLHKEDLLSEALPEPAKEQLFAVITDAELPADSSSQLQPAKGSSTAQHKPSGKTLQVRVITPELACSRPNITSIPLLPENGLTLNSTLLELQGQVRQHLGLPVDEAPLEECVCNCALARQIDENAALNELGAHGAEAMHSMVVVYGTNKVALAPVDVEPRRQDLRKVARLHINTDEIEGKAFSVIGGIEEEPRQGNSKFLKLPVLSFCSPTRHGGLQGPQHATNLTPRTTLLDLHTSEIPIKITSHNANISLLAAGLEDCLINNVLNIYAVKRYSTAGNKESDSQGQDEIFSGQRGCAWEHPLGQSERGLANLLSSLRVFATLTGDMEDNVMDAVLHMFNILTRFPPVVRSVYRAIQGQTLGDGERAAISQCMYELLKDVVPLQIIKSDPTRLFEGSRLLLGLVLDKAKHLKTSMHQQGFPYIDAMKTHELRNMITMEPVTDPMQTMSGLVDRGLYDVFKKDGFLRWTNGHDTAASKVYDRSLQRAALLTGGKQSQVVAFSIDTVYRSRRYLDLGDVDKVISPAEYSDLYYLASLCSQNKLGVLPPSSLPSADAGVLTLDRQGFLAVYVGREACAQAGHDISIFSPTKEPTVSAVDVAIVIQTLVPILNQRNADGTAIFEKFGDHYRRIRDPEEIVMLVVDCSASMGGRCGFIDIEANEDAFVPNVEDNGLASDEEVEDAEYELPTLSDLKEFLSTHESFADILAITRTGRNEFQRTHNAEKVLALVQHLMKQELRSKKEELENMRLRASQWLYRRQLSDATRALATMRNRLLRLNQHKDLLAAFLVYRAENDTLDEPLTWTAGQTAIPKIPKKIASFHFGPTFEVPLEYLCPISTEIMEDPVTTADGFVYARKNIERWFRGHDASPCTNLKLTSFELRPNVPIKQDIGMWISGNDILSKYPSVTTMPLTVVTFKSPLERKNSFLPSAITMDDLYQLAYRITRGRYAKFELHHCNVLLEPSAELASPYLKSNQDIFIAPLDTVSAPSSNEVEDLCLVKVYNGYDHPVVSYWESTTTTKTTASTLWQLWRAKFLQNPSISIDEAFVVWTGIKYVGDNNYQGNFHNHWGSLSTFMNRDHAIGCMESEPVWYKDDDEPTAMSGGGRILGPQPLVLKLYLNRAPRKNNAESGRTLTRLDVLKQTFEGFVNRLLAYNFGHHIGLVATRSKAHLTQGITHAVEDLRHQLNNITASGDTALWDSIALAAGQLDQYKQKYPKAKLRILCLSDGEDTNSKRSAPPLSRRLMKDKILLDSISLGTATHAELKCLSYLTGGYIFSPNTLEEAMAICEMEPVLSQSERPDVVLPPDAWKYLSQPTNRFNRAFRKGQVEVVTQDRYPKRREHPGLSKSYIELNHFARRFKVTDRSDNKNRLSRIHNEIRNSSAKPHPHYDIYICESSFNLWKIVMQGPPGSSYENGTFMMYLEMGDEYPRAPPTGRFITPIYHPNINRHGRICHSILDRNWTVDTSNKTVIDTVYSLLLIPEFANPINAVVVLNFHWDEVQFKEEVEKHIAKHATKDRAQWKKEIAEF